MTTTTFYRKADISKAEAIGALLEANEGAEIVSVNTKRATPGEARTAGVKPGDRVYEATIRTADGNPFAEKKDDSDSGDSSDSPDVDLTKKDKKDDSSSDSDSGSGSSDSDSDSDSSADSESGGDDPFGAPEEPKGEDKIIQLLQQLVDAVGGGAPLGPDAGAPGDLGPDAGLPPAGPDPAAGLGPDIGAPAPGEAPLPPPVPEKRPAAFASVTQRVAASGEAELVLRDVDGTVTTTQIVRDASAEFPTHKVAKVVRNGVHPIKGTMVDLPAHKIALVTLVRK